MKDVFAGEATVSVGGGQPLSQKVYVQGSRKPIWRSASMARGRTTRSSTTPAPI
ncbi:hypothetical protein ACFQ4K_07895 [Tistrella bauzanensis]